MATWKLSASTTFEIFPLSTCAQSQQTSYISKAVQPIFEIFASARKCWGWAFGWEVSRAQLFYFWKWKDENFAKDNIWNFATFNLYTLLAKILYLQRVINQFSKYLPQLEDVEGGHLGGKFQMRRFFPFAMGTWKLCPSRTFEILPLSTCTLWQQKSYISIGTQPIFGNFASARRCWGWALGWIVSGAQVFYFCNSNVKT